MYSAVKEVSTGTDYTLILKFANGEKKRFDMKPYLDSGIFRELKDIAKFNTVHISFDSIAWESEADFDPEVLFERSEII
jgi:hypothetical protein